ncbi:MAG: hypothetical protein ACREI7_13680, partial [Myxococcota bacterium]
MFAEQAAAEREVDRQVAHLQQRLDLLRLGANFGHVEGDGHCNDGQRLASTKNTRISTIGATIDATSAMTAIA